MRRDPDNLLEAFKGGGGARVGIIVGAVTGTLAGIGLALALGYTFFKGGDDLDYASFWSVVIIFGLIGLMGGAWGGALMARSWNQPGDDEHDRSA